MKIWVPGWPVVINHSFYCHGSAALVSIELEIPAITFVVSNHSYVSLEGHLQCCVVLQFVEGAILNQETKMKVTDILLVEGISHCTDFRSRETQIYDITFPLNFSLQFLSHDKLTKKKRI